MGRCGRSDRLGHPALRNYYGPSRCQQIVILAYRGQSPILDRSPDRTAQRFL
jgi:hypothetical protein